VKLLIYAVPLALIAAQAAAAPAGWGGRIIDELGVAPVERGAPLVLVQYRRGGGGAHVNRANVNRAKVNRANINRTNVNRNFNSNNFQRNVSANRNVSVSGGNYGPNWGGVAAGVAVGSGVTAVASAAARSASYPPAALYIRSLLPIRVLIGRSVRLPIEEARTRKAAPCRAGRTADRTPRQIGRKRRGHRRPGRRRGGAGQANGCRCGSSFTSPQSRTVTGPGWSSTRYAGASRGSN
jgi:hypothetical protein